MGWLSSPDIPFARDDANRFLPWIIAFMVCLTGLTLAAAISLQLALFRWGGEYYNSFTVQIPAQTLETAKVEPKRIVSMLQENDWATSAREIPRSEMRKLIEPWLGNGEVLDDLPLPALIEVKLKEGSVVDIPALERRLQTLAPGAEIDDYQMWIGRFKAFSRNLQLFAGALAVLLVVTTLALVVLAAKTALRLHERTVDVLYTIGAEDGYIARQFRKNAFRLVLRGAVGGAVAAFAIYLLAGQMTARFESALLPSLQMTAAHWALFIALPLVTSLIASRFTHRSVLALLARRP